MKRTQTLQKPQLQLSIYDNILNILLSDISIYDKSRRKFFEELKTFGMDFVDDFVILTLNGQELLVVNKEDITVNSCTLTSIGWEITDEFKNILHILFHNADILKTQKKSIHIYYFDKDKKVTLGFKTSHINKSIDIKNVSVIAVNDNGWNDVAVRTSMEIIKHTMETQIDVSEVGNIDSDLSNLSNLSNTQAVSEIIQTKTVQTKIIQTETMSNNESSNKPNDKSHNKNEEIDDSKLCKMCMNDNYSTVNVPCGHLFFCKLCKDQYLKMDVILCPICRRDITMIIDIFE